jgi:hypothetical protein
MSAPLRPQQNAKTGDPGEVPKVNLGPTSSVGFMVSPILSNEMIKKCLDAFFTQKYPIMPILDRSQVYASLPRLQTSPEQYALITSLCAVIILQSEILESPTPSESSTTRAPAATKPTSEFLIQETIRARQFCDYIDRPTLASIHTSFFLFATLFSLGEDNSAWFYIREAMTLLQLLRLHEEPTYSTLTAPESTCSRRTFWLLFVTERAYALQRHRPLTLQRTIDLPTLDQGPESTILSGFLDLVSLFQNFDDNFLSLWNLSNTNAATSSQSLVTLQSILKSAIPHVSSRTEIQQADLLISQQWLKTMVWQLCVTKGLLSSSAEDESMNFRYPIVIARDVVSVSKALGNKAFEAHGVGLLEKVFDVGCSLADVLLVRPDFASVAGFDFGPRDYLLELMKILRSAKSGNEKFLKLLEGKASECLQGRVREMSLESEYSREVEQVDETEEEYMAGYEDNQQPLELPETAQEALSAQMWQVEAGYDPFEHPIF